MFGFIVISPVSGMADGVDVWVETSDQFAAESGHHRDGGCDQSPIVKCTK
jgi:hypothetical protein